MKLASYLVFGLMLPLTFIASPSWASDSRIEGDPARQMMTQLESAGAYADPGIGRLRVGASALECRFPVGPGASYICEFTAGDDTGGDRRFIVSDDVAQSMIRVLSGAGINSADGTLKVRQINCAAPLDPASSVAVFCDIEI